MSVFEAMASNGAHEQVVFCEDRRAGLRAIIAIHDTTLGPALGGLRMWPYKSEAEALRDVLRLARGMTYKAAAAGLNLGGGKAVIIGDPRTDKSEALFRVFGRFVESLNGRYITAEDVGTSVHDMEYIFMETKYVTGVAPAHGGSGDPSPVTAFGVFQGMKAAMKTAFGSESFQGKHVAVQGLGNVGRHLIDSLVKAGARITVTDIDEEKCEKARRDFGAAVVAPDAIYDVACDVFSPNALGAVINDTTLPRLKCKVLCGGANNQLAEERHGMALREKGILYAPDFVVNAGGLINVYVEMEGYVRDRALRMAEGIYNTTERVINISREQGVTTAEAADRFAEERIERIGNVKRGFFGGI
ncbi:MAG: Glu/Leu/Phe/Val dehydrogenase [Planctomycetes bacterium]|nr:Glu/Leu/Phe/Val dehydrogenase [Planctomycetota bacterium]MCW8139524.1 Glu/Leu/Phe/Val dehydrogenase [Planctomycetota bacterium]